jgi:Kef-type K+ transport system membrane component KefB
MNMVFSIIFCWSFFFVVSALFRRLRISVVVGMILAGIVMGSTPFRETFIDPNTAFIEILGDIGLLAIMFVAGLEVSWSMLYKERVDAAYLAFLASVTTFILGSATFLVLGFPPEAALFAGVSMSITAEATKARVLTEMRKLQTRIGSLMMGAGILDDMLGMGIFFVLCYIFHTILPAREVIMLAGIILSFFLGVIAHREIGRHESIIPHIEKIVMYLLVPFFFISMGLSFSIGHLLVEPLLVLIVVAVAFTGKMLGTMLTKPFTGFSLRQLYMVGWAMNSRGAVELALVFIAFRSGLLSAGLYSSLMIMAMATTLAFPLFFTRIVRKNPGIMN